MTKKNKAQVDFPFANFAEDRIVEQVKLSEYRRNRTVYIDDEIDTNVATRVEYMLEQIARFDMEDKKNPTDCEPMILKINSPGGDVYSSMSIISCIESLRNRGFTIHTYAMGMAMSGAFKIFIAGSKRICQRNTHFMCHQPSSFEYGFSAFIDKERNVEVMRTIWQRLKCIIIQYTYITPADLDKITENNKDWFMWADEALGLGVVDEIV